MAPAATPMTRKTIMSKIIVMSELPLLGAPESRPAFDGRLNAASALQGAGDRRRAPDSYIISTSVGGGMLLDQSTPASAGIPRAFSRELQSWPSAPPNAGRRTG